MKFIYGMKSKKSTKFAESHFPYILDLFKMTVSVREIS